MRLTWLLPVAALLAAGCGGTGSDTLPPSPRLASGAPLPAECAARTPRKQATVTFVANGHAWALEPGTRRLTCLFPAANAGPFEWGPRADRALLAHLEVRSFGSGPSRAPGNVDPTAASWGRPVGKSIVFVGNDGRSLLKTHPTGGGFVDVTPVRGARYEQVVYHPSGLAFAFVLERAGHKSIWISSNVGKDPKQLVHGRIHTDFEALAFADAGTSLYFAAQHMDGHVDVHVLRLGESSAAVAWSGKRGEHVSDLLPGWRGLALTVGSSCEFRRAVVTTTHAEGVDALPGRPSRAIGWLDDSHVLVAAGGCGRRVDLYSIDSVKLGKRLLVRSVGAAAVRRAEPLPAPPPPRTSLAGAAVA